MSDPALDAVAAAGGQPCLSPLPCYTVEQWRAMHPEERDKHFQVVCSRPDEWTITYLMIALRQLEDEVQQIDAEARDGAIQHIKDALAWLGQPK